MCSVVTFPLKSSSLFVQQAAADMHEHVVPDSGRIIVVTCACCSLLAVYDSLQPPDGIHRPTGREAGWRHGPVLKAQFHKPLTSDLTWIRNNSPQPFRVKVRPLEERRGGASPGGQVS
ncbi:hypothetical protein EYF80_064120 [Liparis tanakae]|uniref:Uncharacterized protein n=1 Tax=Liparis tanakae TaxID=230148 RepID=A0A4Z2EA98_9TELE|nr:hypothetical protein EYF80_064120 [Liparis tanakae]